ncbi:hypothetical protein ILUMI_02208 [Ignelater luminosus]|uniref:Reverse transcriptase domain-containing protein n=1 Tax=Ignelater luminosus TaxID=2038154 RepID=A0A8K0GNE9_IGNLU|nr:hypothetical protein ILUMI_02208 [Ignelater luminosus]
MAKSKDKEGIPHGSVLGVLLWNIFYDNILRLTMPKNAITTGYADDIAEIVRGRHEQELEDKAKHRLNEWLKKNRPQLVAQKTEAVLLIARRRIIAMSIEIENV